MSADPADIARFTNDGVVVSVVDAAIEAAHPEASDEFSDPIEMFFVNQADGLTMLTEKFGLRSLINPAHEGIEVEESLRLGQVIPIAPTVPCFRIVDEKRGLDVVVRTRAYAFETEQDRFSIEVIQ